MVVVLFFDPDPGWRERAGRCRSLPSGPEIITAGTFGEATTLLREREVDAVVADPPGTELLALHSFVRLLPRPVPLVLFMQPGREALAIRAVDGGGVRYVEKGGDPADRLRAVFALVDSLCRRPERGPGVPLRDGDGPRAHGRRDGHLPVHRRAGAAHRAGRVRERGALRPRVPPPDGTHDRA